MLHKVNEYDIESKKVIYLAGESVGEKAYYLLTAVIQDYKGLTQVVLRAHSDKKYGLNGFMNEMADSLRHLVGSVQNAKEIGIIEKELIMEAIRARKFSGVDSLREGMKLIDFALQVNKDHTSSERRKIVR
jgi:hypothetical protein